MNFFETGRMFARELCADEVPALQALYDANPEYFRIVDGAPAAAGEAAREFAQKPPAHLTYSRHVFAGLYERPRTLAGCAIVDADLGASGVWHLALFWLATRLHGSGDAQALYAALEDWARRGGAGWMRLAVVQGNRRAERFWRARGFEAVRSRPREDGKTILVCVKPLAGKTLGEYLSRVPRDMPGSLLP